MMTLGWTRRGARHLLRTTLIFSALLAAAASAREPTPPPPPPSAGSGAPRADSVVPDQEGKKTKVTPVKGQALAAAMQGYLHAFLALSDRVDAVPVVVWDRTKKALRITLVGSRESTVEASSTVRIFRKEALVRTLEILEYAYETRLDTDDYYIEYRSKKDMKLWSRFEEGKFHTP